MISYILLSPFKGAWAFVDELAAVELGAPALSCPIAHMMPAAVIIAPVSV